MKEAGNLCHNLNDIGKLSSRGMRGEEGVKGNIECAVSSPVPGWVEQLSETHSSSSRPPGESREGPVGWGIVLESGLLAPDSFTPRRWPCTLVHNLVRAARVQTWNTCSRFFPPIHILNRWVMSDCFGAALLGMMLEALELDCHWIPSVPSYRGIMIVDWVPSKTEQIRITQNYEQMGFYPFG